MDRKRLPVIYADTAVINSMVAGRAGYRAKGLLAAIDGGLSLLALSNWHMLEFKKGLDKGGDEAQANMAELMRLLSRLESAKKLQFMAWSDSIWEYELRQKQGTFFGRPEEWAFVDGPTDLMRMPYTDRELSKDLDLQFFDAKLMNDRYAPANEMFDEKTAALHRDRDRHLRGEGRLPFNQYLREQVKSRHWSLSSMMKRLEALQTPDQYVADYPSLWAYSMMRLALTETRTADEDFKPGDVRDMIHFAYLPYVSLLSIDKENFKMVKAFKDMPSKWMPNLVKNGDLMNDTWTPPAGLA